MKERTDDEIYAKCKEIWPNAGEWQEDGGIKIDREEKYIDITIEAMYTTPSLSFAKLNEVAKFFDTLKVETEEEFAYGGCETCDYGSRHGFTLRISPGDPYKDVGQEEV